MNLPHTRLTGSGHVNQHLQVTLDSTNLDDLHPFINASFPKLLSGGNAHFDGTLDGPINHPQVAGNVSLDHFTAAGETWDRLRTHAEISSASASFTTITVDAAALHASGTAHVQLTNWSFTPAAPGSVQMQFRAASLTRIAELLHLQTLHLAGGSASGAVNVQGRLNDPLGNMQLRIQDLRAFNQRVDQVTGILQLRPGQVEISNGNAKSGPANLAFSGTYSHGSGVWTSGQVRLKADSNAFPLSALAIARQYEPAWNAQMEVHADAGLFVRPGHIQTTGANGTIVLRRVTLEKQTLGDITLDASTKGDFLYAGFSGDLRETNIKGNAEVHLVPGSPIKGQLQFDRVGLRTIYALLNRSTAEAPAIDGFSRGSAKFEGMLQDPSKIKASVQLDDLQVDAATHVARWRTGADLPQFRPDSSGRGRRSALRP